MFGGRKRVPEGRYVDVRVRTKRAKGKPCVRDPAPQQAAPIDVRLVLLCRSGQAVWRILRATPTCHPAQSCRLQIWVSRTARTSVLGRYRSGQRRSRCSAEPGKSRVEVGSVRAYVALHQHTPLVRGKEQLIAKVGQPRVHEAVRRRPCVTRLRWRHVWCAHPVKKSSGQVGEIGTSCSIAKMITHVAMARTRCG
jgi:hypothetical protein